MTTTPIVNQPETGERLITGEEFYAMGEEATMGLELVAGRIVGTNMPTGHPHGVIELNIGAALRQYARDNKSGQVMVGEVGIFTRRQPDRVRGADVIYISKERFAKRQSQSFLDVVPEIVVEVVSPNDTWRQFNQKLHEYFEIGVRNVWVVDPESKSVVVYRSFIDFQEFTEADGLTAADILPGFSLPVHDIFEDL